MRYALLPLLLVSAIAAPLAHADTYQFTFTGAFDTDYSFYGNPLGAGPTLSFSWQLAAPPTLETSDDGEPSYFRFVEIPVASSSRFNGDYNLLPFSYSTIEPGATAQDIAFCSHDPGYFDEHDNYCIANLDVPSGFYTGPDSAPAFQPGTYSANYEYQTYSIYNGTLTVADLSTGTTPTPEPSTLLLLGTGLASATSLLRRRHSSSRAI